MTAVDHRTEKLSSGFRKLKVFRIVFLVAVSLFGILALVVGLKQSVAEGTVGPAVFGLVFAMFGLFVGGGVWYIIEYFMKSSSEMMVKLYGTQFEQDLTGEITHWSGAEKNAKSVPSGVDTSVQTTVSVAVKEVEVTLQLSSANLFTKDDLRGNIDIVVAESSSAGPTLVSTLSDRLTLRIPGRQTTLSCLSYGDDESDGSSIATVLGFSVSDLIEEFEFNRQQLELWLDELAASCPMIDVLWDDRVIAEIPCHVAD